MRSLDASLGIAIACLLLVACGGGNLPASGHIGQEPNPAQQVDWPERKVALDETITELNELTAPQGVDEAVFQLLKAELAQVLEECYGGSPASQLAARRASGLTVEQLCQAWCLNGKSLPSGTATISWRGRHMGDYDLNGEVNISDLTPLGVHFGKLTALNGDGLPQVDGDNEWSCQVDGDENGELNIADVTPIGINFSSVHQGYRVYVGVSSDGTTFTWDSAFLSNPDDPAMPVTLPFNKSTAAGQVNLYSVSFPLPELDPGQQAYARIVPFDGTAEGTEEIIPLQTGPHAAFECSTCHRLTDMQFRGTEASCQLCHYAPPEDKATAWADAPGMHGNCLMCHAQHGFSIDPPESPCGACHWDIKEAATAAGMPGCLNCHMQAHLPISQPIADSCQTCHTNPDSNQAMAWTAAPGLHAECSSCHGAHSFTISPPTSVCADCHGALISGGHAGGSADCLACHNSPHVPETAVTGMDCFTCHPNPPENPSAEWSSAPGNHAQCFMCHPGEEHGSKPVPPESICANCHEAVINSTHVGISAVCLDCHTYPHLPVTDITGLDCRQCHPNPPEQPDASWDDAPGDHDQCGSCHPGPEHGNKPVPPESICADCHGTLMLQGHGGGLADCFACHLVPHLPRIFNLHDDHWSAGVQCMDCHTGGGGGDPTREKCGACHPGKESHYPETNCFICHYMTW